MALGIPKYGESNWTLGMPQSVFLASHDRHILAYRTGKRNEDHLAAAYFNLMAMLSQDCRFDLGTLPKVLDDVLDQAYRMYGASIAIS